MKKEITELVHIINMTSWSLALGLLIVLSFTFPDEKVSISEKRNLTQKPELTIESVLSTEFMDNLENYLLDQFPYRDNLRRLKTSFEIGVLGMSDSAGYTKKGRHIHKVDYEIHMDKITNTLGNLVNVSNELKNANPEMNIYLSIIPDKSYYNDRVQTFDYNDIMKIVYQSLGENIKYLDIDSTLSERQYYFTDLHWKQEEIIGTANEILDNLGKESIQKEDFTEEIVTNNFNGSYASASSFNVEKDTVKILTNNKLENIKVFDYETNTYINIYNRTKAQGIDPYDVYLDGAKSLLRIENPDSKSDDKLIIFRDSFTSSLVPLLVDDYSEILLVDLRYINYEFMKKIIDFSVYDDALFIYNIFVLNESDTFKF